MNYEEFEQCVLKRENRDFDSIRPRFTDRNIRLLHGIIGINTEVGEIFECAVKTGSYANTMDIYVEDATNFIEELGDLFFYLVLAANSLGLTKEDLTEYYQIEELGDMTDLLYSLQQTSSSLLDMCKKVVFYGKELDLPFFSSNLSKIYFFVSNLSWEFQSSAEEVWEINNKKLEARYGEKFSEDAAINRDLTKERNILEGK